MFTNDQSQSGVSLAWFVIAGMLWHLAWFWLPIRVGSFSESDSSSSSSSKPIEIERYAEKQRVRTSLAEEQASHSKSEYLAEHENRVEKQTRGRVGRFQQNGGGAGALREQVGPGETGNLSMSDLMGGADQSPDQIDGVEDGAKTLLNTQRYLYSSFMDRIVDEIYDAWRMRASDAMERLRLRGKLMGRKSYLTSLKITINQAGEVIAIQTLKGSGVDVFDEAPKEAFWKSSPFPNPPLQMFQGQEFLPLTFNFNFEIGDSAFSISPRRI